MQGVRKQIFGRDPVTGQVTGLLIAYVRAQSGDSLIVIFQTKPQPATSPLLPFNPIGGMLGTLNFTLDMVQGSFAFAWKSQNWYLIDLISPTLFPLNLHKRPNKQHLYLFTKPLYSVDNLSGNPFIDHSLVRCYV